MTAIFSIRPQYADLIISGEKKVEFRRVKCKQSIEKLIIYATSPISLVVGEAYIAKIKTGPLFDIWKECESFSGISQYQYFEYFKGRKQAVAYFLESPKRYAEFMSLREFGILNPPQSFVYVK